MDICLSQEPGGVEEPHKSTGYVFVIAPHHSSMPEYTNVCPLPSSLKVSLYAANR